MLIAPELQTKVCNTSEVVRPLSDQALSHWHLKLWLFCPWSPIRQCQVWTAVRATRIVHLKAHLENITASFRSNNVTNKKNTQRSWSCTWRGISHLFDLHKCSWKDCQWAHAFNALSAQESSIHIMESLLMARYYMIFQIFQAPPARLVVEDSLPQDFFFKSWLFARRRKCMETWTHVMHFKWKMTWTHGTQSYTFHMGQAGE